MSADKLKPACKSDQSTVRIDKWLWAARFYKTRALAGESVNGGKVHLNGQRIKASRSVKLEDCYQIRRGSELIEVVVTGLSGRRGSATVASALYRETEHSIALREHEREQRKLAALQKPRPTRKPDKKQRRLIRKFNETGQ
ncbi:MAG: S4 domain-containing protein [Pseudomonadota bacterium]